MIQELYVKFLSDYARHLSSEQVQLLTTTYAGYLARSVRSSRLMRVVRRLEIEDDFFGFRRRLDGNPYASSRIWRSVWSLMGGTTLRKAARHYRVETDDVEWIVTNLSVQALVDVELQTKQPWIRDPNYAEIEKQVMATRPYCRGFVTRKMTFLSRHDPALGPQDFENDMLCAGLAAAYRSDNKTTDPTHIRNIAWRSATNYAQSLIKHHTTKARRRIERKPQTVQIETKVRIYTRTACWKCKEPSTDALCTECSSEIMQSKDTKAQWDGHREKASAFMRRGVETTEVQGGPHRCDDFQTTTAFLDAPLGRDNGDQFSLLDVLADKSADSPYCSAATLDLVHDLRRQPEKVQLVCAAILGMGDRDNEFDRWLVGRHGRNAEGLRPPKLAKEACEYYGVSPRRLRSVMAPVLGI